MNKLHSSALLLLAAFGWACSDGSTAPSQARQLTAVDVSGGGSTADLLPGDTLRFSITIDPMKSQTYNLGNGHSVYFPAGAVCDPAKSTYGSGTWDTKCPKLPARLVEHVTAWVDSDGHPYEEFSPSIRFMPTTDPAKYVILSFTDPMASIDPSMDILWCPTTNSTCIDEAQSDPTEATQRDPATGKVWRRIKHFSGYNVFAGRDDGSLSMLSPHSGIMLAWGN